VKTLKNNILIIGGAGRVGLPLGLMLLLKNFKITIYDTNKKAVNKIKNKIIIYKEKNSKNIINKIKNKKKKLYFINDLKNLRQFDTIIISINTPVSSYGKMKNKNFLNILKNMTKHGLNNKQLIIIRSSIPVGFSRAIIKKLNNHKNIAYCPERIAQGYAFEETPKLSQIIATDNYAAKKKASNIFNKISKKILFCKFEEAELIKLISNSYRYIHFSIANHFYRLLSANGYEFNNLRKIMSESYFRNSSIPQAEITCGPCLQKDTQMLKSFFKNFKFGDLAISENKKLIDNMIEKVVKKNKSKTIGIFGLTFKKDSDDTRDTYIGYIIKKLKKNNFSILISDPNYKGKFFMNLKNNSPEYVLKNTEKVIILTKHSCFEKFFKNKKTIYVK